VDTNSTGGLEIEMTAWAGLTVFKMVFKIIVLPVFITYLLKLSQSRVTQTYS
jgi:hypothetical protein